MVLEQGLKLVKVHSPLHQCVYYLCMYISRATVYNLCLESPLMSDVLFMVLGLVNNIIVGKKKSIKNIICFTFVGSYVSFPYLTADILHEILVIMSQFSNIVFFLRDIFLETVYFCRIETPPDHCSQPLNCFQEDIL